jgi:hypothetical protein
MVGPNSVEVLEGGRDSPPKDENCDGSINEVEPPCDAGLAIDDPDPLVAAFAIGLCHFATRKLWGVVKAEWVMPDGSALSLAPSALAAFHLGHGLLADLGPFVVPTEGERMLVLSSGTARAPTDPEYVAVGSDGFDKAYLSDPPMGFPLPTPACPTAGSSIGRDGVALSLTITTPANALGMAFDFQVLAAEWPNGVCTVFDDTFLALLTPPPMGAINGNVAFDQLGDLLTVNHGYFGSCSCANGPPCDAGGKLFDCPLGDQGLGGTGFEGHASTGWLEAFAPVDPGGEIELRFTVFDAGDGLLDHTAIVDRFRWLGSSSPPPGASVGP